MRLPRLTKKRGSHVGILLTGQRQDDRFRVDFSGTQTMLPLASHEALVALVRASIATDTGYVSLGAKRGLPTAAPPKSSDGQYSHLTLRT